MVKNIEIRVRKVIADELGVKVEQVVPEARLQEDLKADSLDTVELVMALEDEFNINIQDEDAAKLLLVQDINNYIFARVEGR